MNGKSIILILVVISMLLSSLFARASTIESLLRSIFISDISRSFSTACMELPIKTAAGYNSVLRQATIHKGKIEVLTHVYKQKGCVELSRLEYMNGSIEISDDEADAFISHKYLVVDQALSEDQMEQMNARIPELTESIVAPPALEEASKNFKNPHRIFYDIEIITAKDEILNLQTNAESTVLHIKSNFGTTVLSRK